MAHVQDFASGNEFPIMTIDHARLSLLNIRREMRQLQESNGDYDRLMDLRRASIAVIKRWPELSK